MADNFDNYGMKVRATVDLPSVGDIDKQIRKLEKSISKLQVSGKLDDSSLKALSHQLDTLKATVATANFSPTALTELTNQVNRALENIRIDNINIGNVNNQAQQVGQQIGNDIEKAIEKSLNIDNVINKAIKKMSQLSGKDKNLIFENRLQSVTEILNGNQDILKLFNDSIDDTYNTQSLKELVTILMTVQDEILSVEEIAKQFSSVISSQFKIEIPDSQKISESIFEICKAFKEFSERTKNSYGQTSGKDFFDWIIENGTEAQKSIFNVTQGFSEFQKVLNGLSVNHSDLFNYSTTLDLDTLNFKTNEINNLLQAESKLKTESDLAEQELQELKNTIISTFGININPDGGLSVTLEQLKSIVSQCPQAQKYIDEINKSIQNINSDNINIDTTTTQQEIAELITITDNYGRELDEIHSKLLSTSKMMNMQGELITLFHGSPKDFDKFRIGSRGRAEDELGNGAYFNDNPSRSIGYGNVSQWYANVEKIFDTESELSLKEIEYIYNKYKKEINDVFDIDNLLDFTSYVKEEPAVKSLKNISTRMHYESSHLMKDLGYDAIVDRHGFEGFNTYVILDEKKIIKANSALKEQVSLITDVQEAKKMEENADPQRNWNQSVMDAMKVKRESSKQEASLSDELANTVVQNEEKKQQAIQETANIQQKANDNSANIETVDDDGLLRQSMEYYEQERYYQQERAKALAEGKAQQDAYNAEVKETVEYYKQFAIEADKAYNAQQKLAQEQAEKVNKIQHSLDVGDYDAQIETIKKGFIGLSGDANEAETHVKGLRTALKAMHDATDDNSRLTAEKNYRLELEKTHNQLTIAKAKAKEYVDVLKVQKLRNDIQDWLRKNTAATQEAKNAMTAYLNTLDDVGHVSQSSFNEAKQALDNWDTQMRQAGKLGKSLTETFKDGVKSFTSWAISSGAVMEVWNGLKNGLKTIKDLDTALVDLRKTTDATAQELEDFYFSSNETAKQLGVTTSEVINATSAWSRLGYAIEDATTLAKNSAILASISPEMDIDTATDGLVSTLKAFKIEAEDSLDGVISKINIIGNTQAVDNNDVVDILTRSSSAMAEANNTLEETIALGVAATEITRDADAVGNMLKTVSMRIRGYDEETESYSSDLENLSGTIADLTKTASSPGGISLFTDETKTTYKSTYQILKDISEIYDELDDKTQANNKCLYVQKCA